MMGWVTFFLSYPLWTRGLVLLLIVVIVSLLILVPRNKEPAKQASGSGNVQGDVTASTGSVAFGHGTIINVFPPTGNLEAQRRAALINNLLREYVNTHDNRPVERDELLLQAESDVDRGLAAAGVQWHLMGSGASGLDDEQIKEEMFRYLSSTTPRVRRFTDTGDSDFHPLNIDD
jgi:hypothetical protein